MTLLLRCLLISFLCIGGAQAQSITGILDIDVNKISLFKKKSHPVFNNSVSLRFNKLTPIDSKNTFSLFNTTTGLNDLYVKRNSDSFVYSSSEVLLENRVFSPFNKRVDSFNPNGSHEIGHALLSGALNLLFN